MDHYHLPRSMILKPLLGALVTDIDTVMSRIVFRLNETQSGTLGLKTSTI